MQIITRYSLFDPKQRKALVEAAWQRYQRDRLPSNSENLSQARALEQGLNFILFNESLLSPNLPQGCLLLKNNHLAAFLNRSIEVWESLQKYGFEVPINLYLYRAQANYLRLLRLVGINESHNLNYEKLQSELLDDLNKIQRINPACSEPFYIGLSALGDNLSLK